MMRMKPFFSVVIPTYNRSRLLKEAISSVLSQQFDSLELLIIDDGSSDGTCEMVAKFEDERIRYFFQNNAGKSSARNKGIIESKGDYICFLDSDDYYLPNHLEVLYSRITATGHQIGVYRTGMKTMKNGVEIAKTPFLSDSSLTPIVFFALNAIGTNTLCIHREVFQHFLFDEKWKYFQDTHFLLRVLSTYPIIEAKEYTSVCRVHEERSSYSLFRLNHAESESLNNINAIRSLFDEHGELFKDKFPLGLKNLLVSQKYMDHASGYLAVGKYQLAWKFMIKSIQYDRKLQGFKRYIKFISKFPLKLLFNYPSLPKNDA